MLDRDGRVLALALLVARGVATEDLPQRDVATAVWDVVTKSLWRELEVTTGALVVVAVAAGVVTGLQGRRGSAAGRDQDSPPAYG